MVSDFPLKNFPQRKSPNFLLLGFLAGCIFSLFQNYGENLLGSFKLRFEQLNTDLETPNQAKFLHEEVKVLCAVITEAKSLEFKNLGNLIVDTWGGRCNGIIFFVEKTPNITWMTPVEVYVTKNGDTFERYREALKYIHDQHLDKFDWLLKTDHMAYIVMENLRFTLYQYDAMWPIVIGQKIITKKTKRGEYMSGNYVLSKQSLIDVVEKAFNDSHKETCPKNGTFRDIALAKCFESVNITLIDGVDKNGKAQFFRAKPEMLLFPIKTEEYDVDYVRKFKQGIEYCCSDKLIAINNYWRMHLYYFEYYIYKVHAFGRHYLPEQMPEKMSLEEVIATKY